MENKLVLDIKFLMLASINIFEFSEKFVYVKDKYVISQRHKT